MKPYLMVNRKELKEQYYSLLSRSQQTKKGWNLVFSFKSGNIPDPVQLISTKRKKNYIIVTSNVKINGIRIRYSKCNIQMI